ncbi:MAG TPA: IgGFc-binding protein, partial [Bryobacteraceae bacterium]|nr:IgGFc-binding protein [Bryobacteraceae bacterium]
DDNTEIRLNGAVVATRQRAQFYETEVSSGSVGVIETSGPAQAYQYSQSQAVDNVLSDPFMMTLVPVEQYQSSYVLSTPAAEPIAFENYLNLVTRTNDVQTCRIDGTSLPISWQAIGSTGYSGARVPVSIGAHQVSCSSSFGTSIYGFATYDSYGHTGGGAVKFISAPRCDIDGNGLVNIVDVNAIMAARNRPASGPEDQRDADADLVITVADARACTLRCTKAQCAL